MTEESEKSDRLKDINVTLPNLITKVEGRHILTPEERERGQSKGGKATKQDSVLKGFKSRKFCNKTCIFKNTCFLRMLAHSKQYMGMCVIKTMNPQTQQTLLNIFEVKGEGALREILEAYFHFKGEASKQIITTDPPQQEEAGRKKDIFAEMMDRAVTLYKTIHGERFDVRAAVVQWDMGDW